MLEPLSGYITLAVRLQSNKDLHGEAFNFGPDENQNKTVLSLVEGDGGSLAWIKVSNRGAARGVGDGSALLKLSVDKSRTLTWLETSVVFLNKQLLKPWLGIRSTRKVQILVLWN